MFHVNPSGVTGRCKVKTGTCPYGGVNGDENHYSTEAEAKAAYENTMSEHTFTKTKALKGLKKFTAVGGVLLSTVSLTACNDGFTSTVKDKADHAISKQVKEHAKDKLQKTIDAATSEASKAVNSDNSDNKVTTSSDGEVLFRGKSLKVSQAEVDEALSILSKTPVRGNNKAPYYNREDQFGGFTDKLQGVIEHRDIPNGEFKSSANTSRANTGTTFVDPYTGKNTVVIAGSFKKEANAPVVKEAESKGYLVDTDLDHGKALKNAQGSLELPLTDAQIKEVKANPAKLLYYYNKGDLTISRKRVNELIDHPKLIDDAYMNSTERHQYANDPVVLQVASSSANRAKGDRDLDEYLPSYKLTQCPYVVAEMQIYAKYSKLSITPQAKSVAFDVLKNRCVENINLK